MANPPSLVLHGARSGAARAVPAADTRRTAREQIGLAVLAVERAGRGALARMRRSRLLRWRYRAPAVEELLLAPPDLRGRDTSFADEAAAGSFGLAGFVATLGGRSPFAVEPPAPAWARELNGFGWLRHLEASPSREARAMAEQLVRQWMRAARGRNAHAWAPEVVGRRVLSWLAHAGVLLDGGHASRNPATLVELLLDLLPLRQCLAARGQPPDRTLLAAVTRMTGMLRHLRLGCGALARFNGMGATERDALATVLAYDEGRAAPPESCVRSGYGRLQRGETVILLDAGAAPPLELTGAACAGCLSFEMSAGAELLIVNGGTPAPPEAGRSAIARATASHTTLCLGEQSSAKLMRNARLERAIGNTLLRHPDRVACEVRQGEGGTIGLEASHDGYVEAFGLIHTRTLALDAAGTRLEGCDKLTAAKGTVRFPWDVPFAIHFHIHPDAEARVGTSLESADLLLDNGGHWRLTASGAAVSIEESQFFADAAGVRRTRQVVLRAQCSGATEVRWTLQQIRPGDPKARNRRRGAQRLSARLAETTAGFDPPS